MPGSNALCVLQGFEFDVLLYSVNGNDVAYRTVCRERLSAAVPAPKVRDILFVDNRDSVRLDQEPRVFGHGGVHPRFGITWLGSWQLQMTAGLLYRCILQRKRFKCPKCRYKTF